MKNSTLSQYLSSPGFTSTAHCRRVSEIIKTLALAGKMISRQVREVWLDGMVGETGDENVHGEQVKKLDEYANEIFVELFRRNGQVGTLISEEMGEPVQVGIDDLAEEYLLTYDPLDGSSNIDVNVTIGSIFGLYRLPKGSHSATVLLQPGRHLIACGYALYGPATNFVFWSENNSVCNFVLDMAIGEFRLLDKNLRIPEESSIYSVNEANYPNWDSATQEVVDYLRSGRKESSTRYIGSLVGDFHRNMLKGGVYLYPGTVRKPEGKIRLMYEAAPLARLAVAAGGRASDGYNDLLDIVPETPHHNCPTIIGSANVVAEIMAIYAKQSVRKLANQ